jgi:hypothetical protein
MSNRTLTPPRGLLARLLPFLASDDVTVRREAATACLRAAAPQADPALKSVARDGGPTPTASSPAKRSPTGGTKDRSSTASERQVAAVGFTTRGWSWREAGPLQWASRTPGRECGANQRPSHAPKADLFMRIMHGRPCNDGSMRSSLGNQFGQLGNSCDSRACDAVLLCTGRMYSAMQH